MGRNHDSLKKKEVAHHWWVKKKEVDGAQKKNETAEAATLYIDHTYKSVHISYGSLDTHPVDRSIHSYMNTGHEDDIEGMQSKRRTDTEEGRVKGEEKE